MTSRRARLEDYVRQATAIDAETVARLLDRDVKQSILEEIMAMQTSESVTPSREQPRRRVLVAVAAVLAVAAAVAFVSLKMFGSRGPGQGSVASGPTQATAPEPSGDLFGPVAGLSCVEQYSPATVAGRGFAFSGTVASIGTADASAMDPSVPVTLTVERWFRGGRSDEVTVAMFAPDAITSAGGTPYKVGSRLLVSGERRGAGERPDELLAWACGFTRWYSPTDAGVWDGAFQ